MKLRLLALALSTSCLALSACTEKRVVVPLPIPPERMDCTVTATRPVIQPEYSIDWTQVVTVEQARHEHEAFVTRIRQREGLITGYIVAIEKTNFLCANDAAWLRDYSAALPKQ